jgi:hypothetical protein
MVIRCHHCRCLRGMLSLRKLRKLPQRFAVVVVAVAAAFHCHRRCQYWDSSRELQVGTKQPIYQGYWTTGQ